MTAGHPTSPPPHHTAPLGRADIALTPPSPRCPRMAECPNRPPKNGSETNEPTHPPHATPHHTHRTTLHARHHTTRHRHTPPHPTPGRPVPSVTSPHLVGLADYLIRHFTPPGGPCGLFNPSLHPTWWALRSLSSFTSPHLVGVSHTHTWWALRLTPMR